MNLRKKIQPEALKSLYRSPGYKKNQLVLCKKKKFVKDLPMIDAQFRFNQCNSFREENISVFSHMTCGGSHLGFRIGIT